MFMVFAIVLEVIPRMAGTPKLLRIRLAVVSISNFDLLTRDARI